MANRSWLITGVGLAVFGIVSLVAYLVLQPRSLPESVIYGNGHIEGTDIRIAAEIPGRIWKNLLVEGTVINAGQEIVQLAPDDYKLRLEAARAQHEAATASLAAIEEQLRTARHHKKTADADLARAESLAKSNTLSQQRLDEARNTAEERRGQVGTLEAREAEARANIDALAKELALAERNLSKTLIAAPSMGTVTDRLAEDGEVVAAGQPVGILVDLSALELKVYVAERELGKIRIGASARVRVDAFPDRYFAARVKTVDAQAQFTPRDIHMPEERARTVFGVTLALENPKGELKPGMPADAWILWPEKAEWPSDLFVPR